MLVNFFWPASTGSLRVFANPRPNQTDFLGTGKPLVDLFGHMGRYRVELDLTHSPWLQRYFDYHWAAIGNLGVDLLVIPLGKLIGLEPAVKLIVLAIPPLTAAGFLWALTADGPTSWIALLQPARYIKPEHCPEIHSRCRRDSQH